MSLLKKSNHQNSSSPPATRTTAPPPTTTSPPPIGFASSESVLSSSTTTTFENYYSHNIPITGQQYQGTATAPSYPNNNGDDESSLGRLISECTGTNIIDADLQSINTTNFIAGINNYGRNPNNMSRSDSASSDVSGLSSQPQKQQSYSAYTNNVQYSNDNTRQTYDYDTDIPFDENSATNGIVTPTKTKKSSPTNTNSSSKKKKKNGYLEHTDTSFLTEPITDHSSATHKSRNNKTKTNENENERKSCCTIRLCFILAILLITVGVVVAIPIVFKRLYTAKNENNGNILTFEDNTNTNESNESLSSLFDPNPSSTTSMGAPENDTPHPSAPPVSTRAPRTSKPTTATKPSLSMTSAPLIDAPPTSKPTILPLTRPPTTTTTEEMTTYFPTFEPTTKLPTLAPQQELPSPATTTTQPPIDVNENEELEFDEYALDALLLLSDYVPLGLLDNPKTPQGLAYSWIITEDRIMKLVKEETEDEDYFNTRILQRFALVAMSIEAAGDDINNNIEEELEQSLFITQRQSDNNNDNNNNRKLYDHYNRYLQNRKTQSSNYYDYSTNSLIDSTIHECEWYGVTCANYDSTNEANNISNKNYLITKLKWSSINLMGQISPEITLLHPSLQILDFANNDLYGTLDYIYELYNLKELYLFNNKFSGTISTEMGSLTSLEKLYLGHNLFSGTLPREITSNTLEFLILHHNNFSGNLPGNLQVRNLRYLDLSYNNINGHVPDEWVTRMGSLRFLFLDHNRFSGSLPEMFSMLGNGRLKQFYINDNQFTGEIPSYWGTNIKTLTNMNVQNNNFDKRIADQICQMSVYNEGELVELRADCDICTCDTLCFTCIP